MIGLIQPGKHFGVVNASLDRLWQLTVFETVEDLYSNPRELKRRVYQDVPKLDSFLMMVIVFLMTPC